MTKVATINPLLGLNSILDLSSNSSQKRLFADDWSELCDLFGKRLNAGIEINDKVERRISKVGEAATKDLEKSRFISYEKEMGLKSGIHADIFSMYAQYFELLQFHSYVFEKATDITESDNVVKIWSPLLERLFRRATLRTKWGDSMGDSAEEENKATGLKVDLRVVKDTLSRRSKEADKANCEVARMGAGNVKITTYRTKVLIESKIILGHLVKEEPTETQKITVPALQLIGNRATLYSLKLEANGLYVALKEGTTAVIPNHVSYVKDFSEVVKLLYQFRNATTDVLAFGLDGHHHHNNDDNNNTSNQWVRGSWVPPRL